MIWEHVSSFTQRDQLHAAITVPGCLFCNSPLQVISHEADGFSMHGNGESRTVEACPVCGWWRGEFHAWADWGSERYDVLHGTAAVLRQFDETGLTEPLDDIRQFLLARYERRHTLAPRGPPGCR